MANLEGITESQPEGSTTTLENTYTQEHMENNGEKTQRMLKLMMMWWKKIFALVCVVAVFLDPFFIYVPIINEDKKCLKMDKDLKKIAVGVRLLTDIIYIGDIVLNITKAYMALKEKGSWKRGKFLGNALEILKDSWLVLLVDFLAILPIPQTVVLIFIPKVKGSGSSNKRKFLNFLLLFQYVPRIFRIYLSIKDLTRARDSLITGTVWIRAAFNLFLYAIASHVLGALWYFFSVQRETACWQKACSRNTSTSGCGDGSLSCDQNTITITTIELLNKTCSAKPQNTNETSKPFDFGIFLEALESGVLNSDNFPEKWALCFSWGLRNLSSLGQNLKTSTFFWESIFAIFISVVGLLLFLYLIGNLQIYMQLATTRSEKSKRKMKLKAAEIKLWLSENGLSGDVNSENGLSREMTKKIMDVVREKWVENKDVNVKNLLDILPLDCRRCIKRLLCFTTLRKVEIFKEINEQVLNEICDRLRPVVYAENTRIIREGEPLDQMLFITQGTGWVYPASSQGGGSTSTKRLNKGDYYGEELVERVLTHLSVSQGTLSDLPIWMANVKSQTKVEALALRSKDLKQVIRKLWRHFRQNPSGLDGQYPDEKWKPLAISDMQSAWRRGITRRKKSMVSLQIDDGVGNSQTMKYNRLNKR